MPAIPSGEPRATCIRAKLCGLAAVIVLGALVAGCDRCGDWWWQSASQACHKPAPRPQ
jgi:hypothetical protein